MKERRILVKTWLRQADADLKAGRAGCVDILECHRRYWLQQACEKGIKALGIILWPDDVDEKSFRNDFLYKHSPLKSLEEKGEKSGPLYALDRQIQSELRSFADIGELIWRVDATTPSRDVGEVSYRYPFVDWRGILVAPADYQEWDSYQGNRAAVVGAIGRFLRSIRNRSRLVR